MEEITLNRYTEKDWEYLANRAKNSDHILILHQAMYPVCGIYPTAFSIDEQIELQFCVHKRIGVYVEWVSYIFPKFSDSDIYENRFKLGCIPRGSDTAKQKLLEYFGYMGIHV